MKKFGNAFLFFIDPVGYKEIKWNLMKKILDLKTADIIFTFMTYAVAFNCAKAKTAKSLDDFFGNSDWKNCSTGDELLKLGNTQSNGRETNEYLHDFLCLSRV